MGSRHLAHAALWVALLAQPLRPAQAADLPLLLGVHVNGFDIDKIGEFVMRDGTLLARPAELRELGFRVPASAPPGPDGLVAVRDLPGVTWRIDQATQTFHATAANERLLPSTLLGTATARPAGRVESGLGATLNYDVTGTNAGRLNSGAGFLDFRVFSPWGVASTTALSYAGGSPNGPGTNALIRLDSSYTYSDVDTLRRYRLGDGITGGLAWTRPIRLGGGQIRSDFALRPDLITFPLPSVSGAVAVPSTVDVLINGTRLFSRQIAPGPFEIPQLPVVTGAGTVSLAVTNALGRQVTINTPFYASSALLAPGLQSFSLDGGFVRRNWGTVNDDYRRLAAMANYRRGIAPWLTLEASTEYTGGTTVGGGGLVANVFDLAVLNVSASGSMGSGRGELSNIGSNRLGSRVSVGVQRIGPRFSAGASMTLATRSFRDIAAINGDPFPRRQINANVGLSLGRFGSIGVAYAVVERDVAPRPVRIFIPQGETLPDNASLIGGAVFLQPAQRAQVLSLSYSVQLGGVALYATGFRDFATRGSSGVLLGLTMPLGGRSSASVSGGGGGTGGNFGQAQAVQSAVSVGDVGYQLVGSTGTSNREFAQVQYRAPFALLTAGVDHGRGQTTMRANAQGAVSFVDGAVFASNLIQDSFAVVTTGTLPGVRVLQENRDAGRTNSSGRLLVPNLRSFDINRIGIEPNDVPPDTTIDVTTREVRPQDRSGVVVRFPVVVSQGALLSLVDAAGAPLPVGSTARLVATGVVVPVGFDGAAYVQGLESQNEVMIELPDGRRCRVAFTYRAVPGDIPRIGPLACRV